MLKNLSLLFFPYLFYNSLNQSDCRSYREYGSADWQIIDIPNDARGERLAIVEDEKEAGVGEDRGTLMLMIFNPVEDVGDYKCEGVYESVLDVPEEVSKFLIANHELRETGKESCTVKISR